MKHDSIGQPKRRPINLTIDTEIVAAAREAGLNLSRVTEDALRIASKAARERQWKEDNKEAIARFSGWYEEHGDPLAHLSPL